VVAILVPRLLILFWIFTDQGITLWFLLHVIALLMAYVGQPPLLPSSPRGRG